MRIKVGDIIQRTPTMYSKSGLEALGPQDCRVVYIHPELRYYVVEFYNAVLDCKFRETFYFANRKAPYYEPFSRPVLPTGGHRWKADGNTNAKRKNREGLYDT